MFCKARATTVEPSSSPSTALTNINSGSTVNTAKLKQKRYKYLGQKTFYVSRKQYVKIYSGFSTSRYCKLKNNKQIVQSFNNDLFKQFSTKLSVFVTYNLLCLKGYFADQIQLGSVEVRLEWGVYLKITNLFTRIQDRCFFHPPGSRCRRVRRQVQDCCSL